MGICMSPYRLGSLEFPIEVLNQDWSLRYQYTLPSPYFPGGAVAVYY